MDYTKENEWYIDGLRNRSKEVILRISEESYPMIKAHVFKNSGQEEDAKDLFSLMFLEVYKNLKKDPNLAIADSKFSTYFFGIGKNQWLKALSRKKKLSFREVPINEDRAILDRAETSDRMSETEYHYLLRKIFSKIPENCKKVLELSWHTNLKGEEIAKKLGLTPGTVRTSKYKCIQKIKKLVQGNDWYQDYLSA